MAQTDDFSIGVPSTRLREAIADSGLSIGEIAERIGVTKEAVKAWLTPRAKPTLARLHMLAKVTGKPVGWFFGEDALPEDIRLDAMIGRQVRTLLERSGVVPAEQRHYTDNAAVFDGPSGPLPDPQSDDPADQVVLGPRFSLAPL